jgi:type I restriction-modification system DNA methylase subunit
MFMVGIEVEDTISSQLTALLQKEKIDAQFKASFQTGEGRKEPDIVIRAPDGLFILEAKVQPAGLPQAMSEADDYRRILGKTENIIGIFAVVYSRDAKKASDVWYSGPAGVDLERVKNLPELAKWMAQKVNEKKKTYQISTQKVINILNENVNLISQSLLDISKEELETIFGGREFFSTVLDLKQESQISDASLKNAAAYLLINQVLFYTILSTETGKYPKINVEEIKQGESLQDKYFNLVIKDDYNAVFGFNVATYIKTADAVRNLKTSLSTIQLLSPESLNHDLLGKIFHNLIPLSLRKIVAAYYTNSEAAEILASLAIENKNDKIIDPACGSGTLLIAAYNRKRDLYHKDFTQSQHVKFLEQEIFGIDIMPFAAHLAAVGLALRSPLNYTNRVNIAINDSTQLAPGITIRAAQEVIKGGYTPKLNEFEQGNRPKGNKIKKGAIDLLEESKSIQLPHKGFDVVIMNPPFTRFQRLTKEYKSMLSARFGAIKYREVVHGQLGLHGYFLLLADKLLTPGGRIAAVLPITTLSLEGFEGIIKLLLQDYQIEDIVVSSGRSAFSENTSLREMLLVAKKEKPLPESQVKVSFIHASPDELTIEKARDIAQKIKMFKNEEEDNNDFYVRQINQQNLLNETRSLYKAINLHSPQLVRIEEKIQRFFTSSNKYTTLGNIEKADKWQIRESTKGVERLGYYSLSILAGEEKALKEHDVWVVDEDADNFLKVRQRFNGQTFKIPRNCVVRQFRRFPGQTKILLKKPYDYVVIRKFEDFDNFLLASSLADKVNISEIKKNIRDGEWEKFVIKNSSNLFSFYRGNLSAPGTRIFSVRSDSPTFTGPGSSWSIKIPSQQEILASVWLNSSFVIYQILRDRNETEGGFIGIDKYLLTEIPYPKLETIELKGLLKLDQEIKNLEFPSLLEQFQRNFDGRRKIDTFFLKHTGMKDEEIGRFLTLLYDTLAKELLRLKDVMGK